MKDAALCGQPMFTVTEKMSPIMSNLFQKGERLCSSVLVGKLRKKQAVQTLFIPFFLKLLAVA
jgi:hypothetical protein